MRAPAHDAIEAAAAQWLARHDSGRWTSDDERALQAWLDDNTAHRVAWLRLRAAWQRAEPMQALTQEAQAPQGSPPTDDAPALPPTRLPQLPPRPRTAWRWAAAAALLMSAGSLWFGLRAPAGEERYSTPVGGLEAITLADGSRVTLNTRTRARALINEQERKVWLDEGEAFFEVQPDPARPFVVAAGGDRITVLGTKFNVRREGGRTQVVVLEGRVRLDRADAAGSEAKAAPTVITHNDAAVAQSGGVLVMAKTAEQVQQDLSWRQGRLAFDHMTLGEIAAEFNRYNRRQIVVEGDAAELRLGGSFDAHNVEGFARLMHEGFGLKVDIGGERIRLSSN
jgi:transmembrane sensor